MIPRLSECMLKQFILAWITLFVVYGFVQDAGYVTDYIGWQLRVSEGGLAGALHTYDYPAQLQGYAVLMWLVEQLRSVSTWLVHVFNTTLYAGATVLLYQLVLKVLDDHKHPTSAYAAGIAAFLFALSPSNTEIMVWRVCQHYLVSLLVWLGTLLLIRLFLQKNKTTYLTSAVLLQTLGLFCLELAYALPIAVLGWVCYYVFFLRSGTWKKALLAFGTSIGLVILHLLLTKYVQGSWIGHYGAEVATSQTFSEIISAPWRWISRAVLHYRFWPTEWRYGLTETLGNPLISLLLYGIVGLTLGRAIQVWLRLRGTMKAPPIWTSLLLWVFLAGAGAAAVSQLYYFDLLLVNNDRLGALTILFSVAFIGTLLSMLPKKLIMIAALPIILVNGYTHAIALNAWSSSQLVLTELTSSVTNVLAKAETTANTRLTVYLLGYSQSFKGVHLLGDVRENQSALSSYLHNPVSGVAKSITENVDFIDLSQFHQMELSDKVNARWQNESLIVALDAPGSWLMHNDRGIKSRRDDTRNFDLKVNEWNIQIYWDKAPPLQTIFLYQEDNKFIQLPYPIKGKSPEPAESK